MSCERCNFIDIDDHVFCQVCLGAPTDEQLKRIVERRGEVADVAKPSSTESK